MCITFMHYFHTKISTIYDISPSVNNTTLTINYGLVKIKTVQVERHSTNTQSSEPDTHYRPSSQEEMQGTGIVETSILEDQSAKITMSGYNIIGFFLLTKSVTFISRLIFSGFPD
uniref:Uncharacterized protein n=1 Tax=Phalaenopsis aphrodite subsp. formosana TaxID=308872 RepID=Q3BAR3_PHAAO|nr:hypothetical protein PhapfoPp002 [Phalaenopsis aphrodite subsp. formosana]AAW82485.1 hypothetical protein [Phalaenopsis aphrodite subsp. formosana]